METYSFTSSKNHFTHSQTNFNPKLQHTLKGSDVLRPSIDPIPKYNQLVPSKEKYQQCNHSVIFIPQLRNQKDKDKKFSKSAHLTNSQLQIATGKTSVQKKFRNTTCLTSWTKNGKKQISQKQLKTIETIMKQKKENFSWTVRQNFSKLNSSYMNCFQNTMKRQVARNKQHRLSQQQSLRIRMQTKEKNSIVLKGEAGFNEKKFAEKHVIDDIFVKEDNMFSIQIEPRKCMDGIFPMFRSGHTLCSIGNCLYLFGGINSKLANGYHFNAFKGDSKQWVCLQNRSSFNSIIPSFHSVETFRNSLIFIGGSALNQKATKRLYNQDILIFDTIKQEYSKVRLEISLRSHASTIYSNMLVIYGGIDDNNLFSNILYFLPLNASNLTQTNSVPYNLGSQGEGIAHHKMVNTFEIDLNLKKKLALDGIICYGGKFADGRLNSDILLFRFNKNRQSTQTQRIIKGWQTVQTNGLSPEPRYSHSMDILYKKCICLVIGGKNSEGQALNDAWILDLSTSSWIKALFDSRYEILERGIFSHATTVMNGELFVFGGLNGLNKISNEFWSVDFTYKRAAKKQEEIKKSRCYIPSSPKITHKRYLSKLL